LKHIETIVVLPAYSLLLSRASANTLPSTDYLDNANITGDKNVKGITDTVGDQFKSGNVLGGLGTGFSDEGMDKMEREEGWTGFAQKGAEGLPKSVAPAVGGVVPGLGGSAKSVGGLVPGMGGDK